MNAIARAVRTALALALVATVVFALAFAVTMYQVWSTGRGDERRAVDAIVVLGAAQYDGRPSPQFTARLDHVIGLWGEDLAPVVVVSGGKQPADRFTEAEAARNYLQSRGVPAAAILDESLGRSTVESLRGVRDVLADVVDGDADVLLVSDPYHMLRAALSAREMGMTVHVSATRTGVTRGVDAGRRNAREALGIMVGRIVGFERLDRWVH
jgi:uncharacterized SAM-binding protein YcdF (DUF218 family)